jgi:5'-deoxynucleotidase YfbR-like HD superfamily hydrolase
MTDQAQSPQRPPSSHEPTIPALTTISRHLDFLYEVGSLRYAIRTWSQFLNPGCQNLSEHTLRVVWIALTIANLEGVKDTSKVMKMALVHDISESRSVDVNYVSRQYADRHEDKAIEATLGGTVLLDEFLPIWEEYEERTTIEVKIVKDADHLDVDLELRELEAMGNKLGKALYPSREQAIETRFFTETARRMWEEIQQSDPHHWHLLARG